MRRKCRGIRSFGVTIPVAMLATVLILVSESKASCDQLAVEYDFAAPQIAEIAIGGDTYHRLTMKDAPNAGDAGQPALPARGARILLPPGTDVQTIEVVPGERHFLGRDYLVEPVGQSYPLSADPSLKRLPVRDVSIYNSPAAYPPKLYERVGIQSFRGYRFLILRLQPVEYIPVDRELYYYSRLTVIVHLCESGAPAALYRGMASDQAELLTKVDNVDVSAGYAPLPRRLSGAYDLLIVTTPDLATSFAPLKEYHDTTGIPTEIHTTADIGSNHPDAVREYIRERYLTDGIGYVLIGGDDDLLPAKDLYVTGGGYTEFAMPGDLYFGCLDGTYNYDGDNRWGESTDGEGGGDVDLVAEVYVGRAPVDGTADVDRFVNKTIRRLASRDIYVNTALLVGEDLALNGPPPAYGGDLMDLLVGGTSTDINSIVGIPPDVYIVTRLYDRDWYDHDWPASELIDRVNGEINIVNHLGHGGTYWAMKMTSSMAASSFTNSEPCFMYSQACNAGMFDVDNCWAECASVKADHAAYAVIMNARFGFSTTAGIDCDSQRYNRQFWDAIFNPYDYHPQIGRANQDAKEDILPWINDGVMRWCYYEINLFGDPTISIDYGQARPGIVFAYPTGLPDTVLPNQQTTFLVDVIGYYGGIPVPASGELHYRINGGSFQSVPMAEITPFRYEATLPAVMCDDVLEYYLSVEETTAGQCYDPSPGTLCRPFINSRAIGVFADDGQTNQGWTVYGDAVAGDWNRGIPQGFGDRGDPTVDYDGNYLCYLTGPQDGDTDVEGGTTYLESPVFDLSADDAVIRYARWYSNDAGDNPHEDVFVVSISNDSGENWTTVETVGPEEDASGGWIVHWFWAGDFVTPTGQVKVRFAAADLGGESIVEAAVDAISVTQYQCLDCLCPGYCDLNADGGINPVDVVYAVNFVYKSLDARILMSSMCPGENGDWDCDGRVNPVDVVYYVNSVYKNQGEPCNPCAN